MRPTASRAVGPAAEDLAQATPAEAAGDSISVATWTLLSRITGVVRIATIGAVLGPTFFGNTFQFTNSLPNLVYYGFLGGSLFSSLLVPALVQHIDSGDRAASERVAGGFLGLTVAALVAVVPIAVLLGPILLGTAVGTGHSGGGSQQELGRTLILLFAPQVFGYAIVGSATAAMNAHRRFALASAAPAFENIGIICILGLTALIYGTSHGLADVPTGEVLLLGLGTTGAVLLHAAVQWWGARRVGVTLRPRAGWRDPEVRVVVRRALPSLAQAGLIALQTLVLLSIANRVAGGVVAFQIALNFYTLAIALGATPVALSLLPRLARMHARGDRTMFSDTLARGYALAFFVAIPASVGYAALAVPLAHAISFGRMNNAQGVSMVAGSIAALSVAVLAQTAFMIATYASYARTETRAPLRSMALQAVVCLVLLSLVVTQRGTGIPALIGGAFSLSVLIGAVHLTRGLARSVGAGSYRMAPSLLKVLAGSALMAGPAWLAASLLNRLVQGPVGALLAIAVGVAVGGGIFLRSQSLLRTPELGWLADGVTGVLGRKKAPAIGVGHV